MKADWDLWPWRIAEGAGVYALHVYRMERSIAALQAEIGRRLYPALRPIARELRKVMQ